MVGVLKVAVGLVVVAHPGPAGGIEDQRGVLTGVPGAFASFPDPARSQGRITAGPADQVGKPS